VGAELIEIPRACARARRDRRHVVLVAQRGGDRVEELGERVLVVGGAGEVGELLEQLGQEPLVIAGQVVGAVIGEGDPLGLVGADRDVGRSDL
jgi:NADPH:quinone reductase-like Zn-dependent oxidoreductase